MSTIKADNIATLAGVSTSMANAVNGSAKAWVNFNGTGTVAIRASYNVSSITDVAVGIYKINLTNALTDTNYAVVGATEYTGTALAAVGVTPTTRTTSMVEVAAEDVDAGFVDYPSFMVVIFR